MRGWQDGYRRLAQAVRAEGGLLGETVEVGDATTMELRPGIAQDAAAGPRTRSRPQDYELVVELIYEGYLAHYGSPRVVRTSDRDLALLAGDQLYALGLARLAELGDLEAVRELADVISLCAQAQTAGDPALAEAVWAAGAVAVGWGSSPAHAAAKEAARTGESGARERLVAVAEGERGNVAQEG